MLDSFNDWVKNHLWEINAQASIQINVVLTCFLAYLLAYLCQYIAVKVSAIFCECMCTQNVQPTTNTSIYLAVV